MKTKQKVLYIDDEKDGLTLFNASFKNDYDLFLANSAVSGQAILDREDISVVISDYEMPETTGVELFERLVKKESKAIRILLTGYKELDIAINAINHGQVFKYLTKPYKKKEIKEVIESACELYSMENDKNALMRDVLDGQEYKNNIISENLHENIAQQLMGLAFFLKEKDETSDRLLKEIVGDLRGITFELTPRSLSDFGLSTALEELLKKEGLSPSKLVINPSFPRLAKGLEIHIFRVVQYFIQYLKTNELINEQTVLEILDEKTIRLKLSYNLEQTKKHHLQFENKIKFLIEAYGGQFNVINKERPAHYRITYPF